MKRVVVTGMSSITSLGEDTETIMQRMLAGGSGIRYMAEWERYADLRTRLGGAQFFRSTCNHHGLLAIFDGFICLAYGHRA